MPPQPSFNGPTLAAAQAPCVDGDVPRNLQTHLAFVQAVAAHGVQLLVFPELSLTGYDLPGLAGYGFHAGHPALQALSQAAIAHRMTLIVGAPAEGARPADLPAIGAWVLGPDGSIWVYRKRHLHAGETVYASAGAEDAQLLQAAGESAALAVCADTSQPGHAQAAASAGATLYAVEGLISHGGFAADSEALAQYARGHGMAVLLANHAGPTGGYASAGRSTVWAAGGDGVVQAPGEGAWLVIARRTSAGLPAAGRGTQGRAHMAAHMATHRAAGWSGEAVPLALSPLGVGAVGDGGVADAAEHAAAVKATGLAAEGAA